MELCFGFHLKIIRNSYGGEVKTVVGLLLTAGLQNDNLKLINVSSYFKKSTILYLTRMERIEDFDRLFVLVE
jgi:hypothetical protein